MHPERHRGGFAAAGLALLVGLVAVSCSSDRSTLTNRPYRCQSDADCIASYACVRGPTRAEDFCAPRAAGACNGVTTQEGACLPACDPGFDDCANGFSCFRTEVFFASTDAPPDPAACVGFQTCNEDIECVGRVNEVPRCLSTILREFSPLLARQRAARTDGLTCVQSRCRAGGSCPMGFTCLATEIATAFALPMDSRAVDGFDYCVPLCGANDSCPPGYGCLETPADLGVSLRLCIPAFPGARCEDDLNCLSGDCLDPEGPQDSICTAICTVDSDCGWLNDVWPGYQVWTCGSGLEAGVPTGVCRPRYRASYFPCDATTACQPGTTCMTVSGVRLCLSACSAGMAGADLACAPYSFLHPRPECPRIAGSCGECLGLIPYCIPLGLGSRLCCRNPQCRSGTCQGLRCTCATDCDCTLGVCNVGSGRCDCATNADCGRGTCTAGRCTCTAHSECTSGMCDLGRNTCVCSGEGECPLGICTFGRCV